MLRLQGQLTIKTIHGRHGPFNVGTLKAEEGEFSVKDALLEEYKEGRYDGQFMVSAIYPYTYASFGRAVTEIRVKLHELVLDDVEDLGVRDKEPMQDPDPIDEPESVEPQLSEKPDSDEMESAVVSEATIVTGDDLISRSRFGGCNLNKDLT